MVDLFCSDRFTPTDKLKVVQREVDFRRYVYPRRVADGKMRQAEADYQLAVMEAILEDCRKRLAPVAFMRDVDGTGSLHPCAQGDAGAFPVFA
jgi:hypothetical protein